MFSVKFVFPALKLKTMKSFSIQLQKERAVKERKEKF